MKIHVIHHLSPELQRHLDCFFGAIIHNQEQIMALLDGLTVDVQANTDVVNSANILIAGLAQQIKDAGTDPVKLKALTDQLEANTASLAASVAANTPAAPTA